MSLLRPGVITHKLLLVRKSIQWLTFALLRICIKLLMRIKQPDYTHHEDEMFIYINCHFFVFIGCGSSHW